jgi:hypothetical protein
MGGITVNQKPKKDLKKRPTSKLPSSVHFPSAWLWFVDEIIPTYVKKHYSPRESWKDKPFEKEDAQFFFKGIADLSALFTEERPKGMPDYFSHPKYRSSYLLYFLPLQAAKFISLFQSHAGAMKVAIQSGIEQGVIRIADLGAGPGTASLAFLIYLLEASQEMEQPLPPIEFHWFDTQDAILKDGVALIEQISSNFPKLRGKVQVKTHTLPWWKAPSLLPKNLSLTFMGHILNEVPIAQQTQIPFWAKLFELNTGGGVLMIEPASRRSSQNLSLLRNFFFESELLERTPTQIWGPCLHAESCPMAEGRDWCHFSVPIHIPGNWFRVFSRKLSSERHWVKYSYSWFATRQYPSPQPNSQLRRVISDPLQKGLYRTVLLCEPETPGRWEVPIKIQASRGDLIRMTALPEKKDKKPRHFSD